MPGKDYKKELKALYTAKAGRIDEIDVPKLSYLMLDGVGEPAKAFGLAIHAMYSVAFPLKFAIKARNPALDFVVMPPEALYPGKPRVYEGPAAKWPWTICVMQPVKPTPAELADAKRRAVEKGAPAAASKVRFAPLAEGHAIQTMHVGEYGAMQPLLLRMRAYMDERGLAFAGAHHEVYLSDPQRVAPARTKTIVRQPVIAKRLVPRAMPV